MAKSTKAKKKKGRARTAGSIRRTTLREVGALAAQQDRFWNSIRKSPARAIRAAGMSLSPRDLARLNRLVRTNSMTIKVRDLDHFVRRAPGDVINEWAEVWIRRGK